MQHVLRLRRHLIYLVFVPVLVSFGFLRSLHYWIIRARDSTRLTPFSSLCWIGDET